MINTSKFCIILYIFSAVQELTKWEVKSCLHDMYFSSASTTYSVREFRLDRA